MFSIAPIEKKYGMPICRRCINRKYHARLEQRHCVYGYVYRCPVCGKNRNIVTGFTLSGHLRMLFK